MTKHEKYTKADIRRAIKKAAQIHGEPLTQTEYRAYRDSADQSAPSIGTISDGPNQRYESWTAACNDAGVEVTTTGRTAKYTDADLIRALQDAADEIGEPMTSAEYMDFNRETDYPAFNVYTRSADRSVSSWVEWCVLAGIRAREYDGWLPTHCAITLRLAEESIDGEITQKKYLKWSQSVDIMVPSLNSYQKYWGSLSNAKKTLL